MIVDRFSYEEVTLHNTSLYQKVPQGNSLRGPLRVARLCILGILVPAMLLSIPLYMRYRVYNHQMYPLAMSDMRLLDSKVSTTWCQRQVVKVNTTFNAFLLPNSPHLSHEKKTLSMVRELVLEDDTKEYWGFYLLKGSSVTVSTCVRWPGASLIVIRGHKHLHECAYIGDNSSEELEEMMEAIKEISDPANATDDVQPVNQPNLMKRHRPDVEFHSPIHKNGNKNHTLDHNIDTTEITDPKALRKILDSLREKTKTTKTAKNTNVHMRVHRNSTIAEGESQNFKIEKPKNQTSSQEALTDILSRLKGMGEKGSQILEKVNEAYNNRKDGVEDNVLDTQGRHYSQPSIVFSDTIDMEQVRRRKREIILNTALGNNEDDAENDQGIEEGFVADGIANHRGTINETTLNDMSNSEFWSSFSSSEEALLNCAGLILNLPLSPHSKCESHLNEAESYLDNTITYRVPVNGYYFFVFNSENEIQPNYIRVQFNLNKVMYDVSNPVTLCRNSSQSCSVPLSFFSGEKLVMELPVMENQTLWNEEFIVLSECEPRTAIYVICLILVPVLVVIFAFT